MAIQLGLNPQKPGNYAFFCPVSRLHLTLSNPIDSVDGVTPNILRALRARTLVDMQGVIDLETGAVKEAVTDTAPTKEPEAPKEEPVADAKGAKKGKKVEQAPTEETVQEEK